MAKNEDWIAARFWGLLLIFIATVGAKGDERAKTGQLLIRTQDVENGQQNPEQPFNVSSRRITVFDAAPPRTACSSTFYDVDFSLISPNYPGNYDHNCECVFVVKKKSEDVCGLLLIFQDFRLEGASGCLQDYLEINGEKLCGSFSPNDQRKFPFRGPEMVIRFRTNAVTSDRGFLIRGSQLTCGQAAGQPGGSACDQTFDRTHFEVTSPNYPAAYTNDLNCSYVVRKSSSDTCFLHITFTSLELRESPGGECLGDFLEIDHQRICHLPRGSTKTVGFAGAAYVFRFRTGSGRPSPGARFSLLLRQLPCPSSSGPAPCGLGVGPSASTADVVFHIRSPGLPLPYPPDQDCVFVVRKSSAGVCALHMTVGFLDVHPSPDCRQDALSVGHQRLCGTMPQGTGREFDFPGEELHIRFRSDSSRSRSGFSLTFRQKDCFVFPGAMTTPSPPPPPFDQDCDLVFTSRTFEIRSPAIGPSGFGPIKWCTYTIRRRMTDPKACSVRLEFLEFDVDFGDKSCQEDFLEINGDVLCPGVTRGTVNTYGFDSQDVLRIRLRSDSVRPARFLIRGVQLPCPSRPQDPYPQPPTPTDPYHLPWIPCNCTLQDEEFLISSSTGVSHQHSFPLWPSQPSFCSFLVHRARMDICHLDLVFQRFDLMQSSQYVEVDGQRYCGHIPPGTLRRHPFRGGVIRLVTYTCGGVFSVRFRQVPCEYPTTTPVPTPPSPCDAVRADPEFRWTSPNYPNPYDSFRECRLTIQRYDPLVCELVVTFNHFDLEEEGANCQLDYLEVMDQRFCGLLDAGMQKTFSFNASTLTVVFHSGWNQYGRSGFDLDFKQQLCLQDGPIFRRTSSIDFK